MIVNFDSIFQNPGQKNIWRNAISKILGYIPKRYITLETITTTVDEVTTYTSEFNTGVSSNAKITLIGDTTLTLSNLQNGFEGNIIVTQDATNYTLNILPPPAVINDGQGLVEITDGAGSKTILSYTYDGVNLYITVGPNYTKAT